MSAIAEDVDKLAVGVRDVLQMLLKDFARRADKGMPEISMKIKGYWVGDIIRIDISTSSK